MQEDRREAAAITVAAGVPLHRQLFLVLHDEIGRGVLAPGAALPTEQSLGDQFGVSRITVRRALADLAEAGLMERRHGVGSFVLARPPLGHVKSGGSYLDELRRVGPRDGRRGHRTWSAWRCPGPVVERLGSLKRGLYALRLRRERRAAEPLMISETWLPEPLAGVVTGGEVDPVPAV